MGQRAQQLAGQLEQANDEVIGIVETCGEGTWQATCPVEGWGANVAAHHIAVGHQMLAGLTQMLAAGQQPPPMDTSTGDQMNAQHAKDFANCSKQEALEALRKNGDAAVALVRGLSDEQLDRSGNVFGQDFTTEQFIQYVLIGHTQEHLGSIKAATGA